MFIVFLEKKSEKFCFHSYDFGLLCRQLKHVKLYNCRCRSNTISLATVSCVVLLCDLSFLLAGDSMASLEF